MHTTGDGVVNVTASYSVAAPPGVQPPVPPSYSRKVLLIQASKVTQTTDGVADGFDNCPTANNPT
jgi:hypothetical protein